MAQGIQNLQLRCIAQQNSENQIVVLAIQLQLPTAYSLLHEEEYAYLCQRLRILDKLYLFNSRIDGVLVEQGPNAFMIFTTRKSVERETRGYQDFYLLQMLREASVVRVCMGIGYGRTANASKFNAYEGIKRAQRHAGGGAYVVFENNEVIGPLNGLRKGESGEDIDQRRPADGAERQCGARRLSLRGAGADKRIYLPGAGGDVRHTCAHDGPHDPQAVRCRVLRSGR